MYDNSKILIDYSNYVPLSRLTYFPKNANALISNYLITLTTYVQQDTKYLQIKNIKIWLF